MKTIKKQTKEVAYQRFITIQNKTFQVLNRLDKLSYYHIELDLSNFSKSLHNLIFGNLDNFESSNNTDEIISSIKNDILCSMSSLYSLINDYDLNISFFLNYIDNLENAIDKFCDDFDNSFKTMLAS